MPISHNQELNEENDAELVVAALAGNTQAFDVLVSRYCRAMLTIVQQIVRNLPSSLMSRLSSPPIAPAGPLVTSAGLPPRSTDQPVHPTRQGVN